MPAEKTPPSLPRSRRVPASIGPFKRFGCEGVTYRFDISPKFFNLPLFVENSGLVDLSGKWSGVCAPRNASSDYHVHFDGNLNRSKKGRIDVFYAAGRVPPSPNETEPFAETVIPWLGAFFTEPACDVDVNAWFEKPEGRWKSRFNLPFKVTVGKPETELVIDGISIALPDNPHGAYHGSLAKKEGSVLVAVKLRRKIDFSKFRLVEDIKVFEEITRLWVEEVTR
jgi:hypothetical protein